MNKKLFLSLSIVAMAFALVLGFGTLNAAKAVPGESGERNSLPPGEVNLIAPDYAVNSRRAVTGDADSRGNKFAPDTYGIRNTLRP